MTVRSIIILSLGITALTLKFIPAPYVWISLTWFIVIMYQAILANKTSMRAVWVNLACLILALGIFEGYLYLQRDNFRFEDIYTDKYYKKDSVFGVAPLENSRVVSGRKYFKNNLLYDVSYTIDENGMRIGPPTNDRTNGECVIFFGGSITYGEGVNDNETTPYLVGIKSDGKYRTFNFGFHGYGPHQMLAAIEKKYIGKRLNCRPKYAIYQSIGDHVYRVTGLVSYNNGAPRYILGQDGKPVLTGSFEDFKKQWERKHAILSSIIRQLKKSEIANKAIFQKEPVKKSDIDLFIEIVDRSRELFLSLYPDSKFYVIYWDVIFSDPKIEGINKAILKEFQKKGINVYLISEILKDYNDNKLEYSISQYDRHPNQKAHQIIADYVVTNILGQK